MQIYGTDIRSRLWLGTAGYPSPDSVRHAVKAAKADLVTVSLRRANQQSGQRFWSVIRELGVNVLPNTAGCFSVKEAVTTAQMAREVFATPWVKLEVITDADTLAPDVFGLVEAARLLTQEGFNVFPYTTSDVGVAERLLEAGCKVLMPMAAPIGSGQGMNDPQALQRLRHEFPKVPLIIDAGLGRPSQAAAAMEMGYDACLLNTAVSQAADPVAMAAAFANAVTAGRTAKQAGLMPKRNMAAPSTPMLGKAWLA